MPAAGGGEAALLGAAPATAHDRRIALFTAILLATVFLLSAPFAQRPLAPFPSAIPAYDAAIAVLDLVTAILLWAQYRELGERSFLALACGFLFAPFLIVVHALSFPDAFVPGPLIGDVQTTAWLWMGWHGLFPLFVAAYGLLARRERQQSGTLAAAQSLPAAAAIATVAFAAAVILVALGAETLLPPLMIGSHYLSPETRWILGVGWAAHVLALLVLLFTTRLRRVIDLWLAVALLAGAIDLALSALLVTGRFQLGFYAGRLCGLLASLFVLSILLRHAIGLHGRLARATAAQQASDERYRLLFNVIDSGFCTFEMIFDDRGQPVDFRYLDANAGFEKQTGRRPRPGQTMREVFPEADHMWLHLYAEVARTGEAQHFVDFVGGLDRWFEVDVFPIGPLEQNRLGALFTDVTERKRAEAALRESEEKFRTLFDSIDEGFAITEMIYDDRGEIVDMIYREVNAAFERHGGIQNVVGRSIFEMLPDVEEYWLDHYKQVARTGQPIRVQNHTQYVGRWFDVYFARVDENGRFVATVFNNITERKKAEAALRESEDRQRFLLALGDAMRAGSSATETIEAAGRLLGERLNPSRVLFAEFDEAKGFVEVFHAWLADGAEPFPTVVRQEDFAGPILDDLRAGRTMRVDDAGDPAFARPDFAALAEAGIKAALSVPLIIGGRLVATLSVHQHSARHWSDGEVSLLQEVAERLWADVVRVRAEAALRQSEERLRRVVETDAVGVIFFDRGGCVIDANEAFLRITGYTRAQIEARELHWSTMTPPEWVEASERELEQLASTGRIGPYEKEQLQADGSRRWMMFAGRELGDGTIVEYFFDITAQKRAEAALRESEQHQRVLLAELQHRVRNTLAVVRSIARRTAETSESVEDMSMHLQGRIDAFARVQAAVTRNPEAGVELRQIVEDELLAHTAREGKELSIDGPDLWLKPRPAESLSLAIHELTSNAVKYGALGTKQGRIVIAWRRLLADGAGERLELSWEESGVDRRKPALVRKGFGLELLERTLPYELGADTQVEFLPRGLRFELSMPLSKEVLAG